MPNFVDFFSSSLIPGSSTGLILILGLFFFFYAMFELVAEEIEGKIEVFGTYCFFCRWSWSLSSVSRACYRLVVMLYGFTVGSEKVREES